MPANEQMVPRVNDANQTKRIGRLGKGSGYSTDAVTREQFLITMTGCYVSAEMRPSLPIDLPWQQLPFRNRVHILSASNLSLQANQEKFDVQ